MEIRLKREFSNRFSQEKTNIIFQSKIGKFICIGASANFVGQIELCYGALPS
jgi:hypothetical protein